MSENKVVYSKWIKRGTNTFIPTDNSQILPEVDAGVGDEELGGVCADGEGDWAALESQAADAFLVEGGSAAGVAHMAGRWA